MGDWWKCRSALPSVGSYEGGAVAQRVKRHRTWQAECTPGQPNLTNSDWFKIF